MSRKTDSIALLGICLSISLSQLMTNAQTTQDTKITGAQSTYVGKMLGIRERFINDALQKDASLDYFEQRFGDIVEELKSDYEIPIIVDESAREGTLDEDTLISLTLSGVSLNAALQIMMHPYNCTCAIKDEVLYILSNKKAEEMLEVRVYDCTPLFEKINAPNIEYDALVQVITTIVKPESWIENGGKSRLIELGGRLVICQTNARHGEIARLLKQLDDEFSD